MAIVLVRHLELHGRVEPGELALAFGYAFVADPGRRYGPSMRRVLRAIAEGASWAEVTAGQFGGQGSWGNGAAMRVAPLGAWFAGDLELAAEQAAAQAVVTHAHPEAAAGAVAVAVAAALCASEADPAELLSAVAEYTPDSEVRSRIRQAAKLGVHADPRQAAAMLGSGRQLSAPDTVPFALWSAARSPGDLTEALWGTALGGGDVDTTCAITGGVVGARPGLPEPPAAWLAACEPVA
nr:ADP-ribosylglycohydrolase family protein [Longispora albida]